ncbi:chromosomal replication initiator protein DnaA [Haloferula sargassicola]|uniref:Chromosomal replication initiator protein DnaA n=1 Tax=Haloferula sargassicola TaxID=490096 RepID=A0ABP9UXF1_9BACT
MEPAGVCSEAEVGAKEDGREVWTSACGLLSPMVGGDAFERWFKAAKLGPVADGVATVEVPNEIHQVWIETNYLDELKSVLGEVCDHLVQVRIEVVEPTEDVPTDAAADPAEAAKPSDWFPETRASDVPLVFDKRLKRAGLNPSFAFDAFVVGANSQFAHAACEAVAEGRGGAFNPLFIHGGPGLGKTHLMQAVGQEWLKRVEGAKVVYLTCEKFINEFIEAVRKGDLSRFRHKYRTAELMLIDDVQFLGGKDRSQEEFFHTFNTLMDGHCQVILTSDRPASEIKQLEPRLVSRFECGLTVELQQPAFETRLAILHKKVEEWGVRVDDGILRLLAERLKSNVRRLEGGLMRVGTYASLAGEQVTVEKVEHLLRDLFREENVRQVTIDSIQRMVAEHYDIRLADMTSRRRPASIAGPRQVAMYLSRTLTKSSLIEIGEAFGGRDHGTVIHAVRKVTSLIDSDSELRDRIDRIQSELRR